MHVSIILICSDKLLLVKPTVFTFANFSLTTKFRPLFLLKYNLFSFLRVTFLGLHIYTAHNCYTTHHCFDHIWA